MEVMGVMEVAKPIFPPAVALLTSIPLLFLSRWARGISAVLLLLLFVAVLLFGKTGEFLQFYVDEFVLSVWAVLILSALLTVFASDVRDAEFYFLLLNSLAGAMLFVASRELVTALICFELISLPFYVICAREPESGLKFFLLGAMGSLLFALSVFAVAVEFRTTYIKEISGVWLVFVAGALAFKVGAFPFHLWVPDTYSGTLASALAYLSTAPKLAGVAFLLKIHAEDTKDIIFALSLLSMIFGNIVAIWQGEFKRLLAYSGIAHIGYALVGAIARSPEAIIFYFVFYVFANIGAFTVAQIFDGEEGVPLRKLDGLRFSKPSLAVFLTAFLLSLGGIPPVLGFWAKLIVFLKGVESGYVHLVAVGAVTSVVALFYYLSVIKRVFLGKPEEAEKAPEVSAGQFLVLLTCFAGTVILSLIPHTLLRLIF